MGGPSVVSAGQSLVSVTGDPVQANPADASTTVVQPA
jgi:hypothetical protein